MKKGLESRQKMIDATGALLTRQGYHATGLADIVAESGAPRGSLYFYFPGGKEELACAALEASGARWRHDIEAAISGVDDSGEAVEAVCRLLAERLEASGFDEGCPLATVALEASGQSDKVRQTIARHYEGWADLIEARLVASSVPAPFAKKAATFVLATIEGALLLAKVQRSTGPLREAGSMLRAFASGVALA